MKVYDTLIVGSGYASIGFAAACPNTVICEEHQICDTGFYLPLRSFRYRHYAPKTEEGARLLSKFEELSLFGEAEQNTNGFEFALCQYIAERQTDLLLKCRVIRMDRQPDRVYDVTVQTNEGLSHLFAKRILDTRSRSGETYFTVLFVCRDLDAVKGKLLEAYCGAQIEPAFYPGRYALHMPVRCADENLVKLEVYRTWCALGVDAKILYMAPVFYGAGSGGLCDANYENPIEAFEAGYFCARGRANETFDA